MGSIRLMTDAGGYPVESYTYDVYGKPYVMTSAGTDNNWLTEDVTTQNYSSIGNPYLFTGRRWYSGINLYYYRFRDYAPDLGRFLQTDPAGYIDTMNLYAYCANNPLNWIDPWGLKVYRLKRGKQYLPFDGPRPTWDPFAHEMRVVVHSDGTYTTYSFTGKPGVPIDWYQDESNDRDAVKKAIENNYRDMELIGGDEFDDDYKEAYESMKDNQGKFKIWGNNCQDAVKDLDEKANELEEQDKKSS